MSRASVLVCAAILAACSQPNGPDPLDGEIAVERLHTEPYAFEFNSGLAQSERLLIRSTAAWANVWARIYEKRSPKPPLPTIDFSSEQIVVAALGARPTGGYSILVTGASRLSGVITVRVESRSPGEGCGTTTAVTEPVDVARIPRSSGPVLFEETAVVRSCR